MFVVHNTKRLRLNVNNTTVEYLLIGILHKLKYNFQHIVLCGYLSLNNDQTEEIKYTKLHLGYQFIRGVCVRALLPRYFIALFVSGLQAKPTVRTVSCVLPAMSSSYCNFYLALCKLSLNSVMCFDYDIFTLYSYFIYSSI